MTMLANGADAAAERFDGLSGAELDELAVAVALIDASGTVVACNAAQGRFFGRPSGELVGRGFFHEVAPSTNLPAFRGRFLDGMRNGGVNESFRFVFGQDPKPILAEVRMTASDRDGLFWIATTTLGEVQPSVQRTVAQAEQVAAAIDGRLRAELVDPKICEREPIHIPGAIQPHVVMLAADPSSPELPLTACSDNVADAFPGQAPADVIGRPLGDFAPAELVSVLTAANRDGRLDDSARPLRVRTRIDRGHDGGPDRPFSVTAHRHDGRLIVELELTSDRPEDFGTASPLDAQRAMSSLRAAASLQDAARVAALEIRDMTGFERVLVYRFDAEWNGEAIAEDQVPDWEQSLLGLRFPASDIPAQARALYTRSPSRFVVDRDAVPSAVLAAPETTNQAVDLTFAHARALSPVHLEYQRNLGVNGSMSISILVGGKLWGLVIGHHRQPHYVPPETRALSALVADAFALRVHELESVRLWREQQTTLATQTHLLEQMARADDFVAAVTTAGAGATLLDLFTSTGAAVVSGSRIDTVGVVPPNLDILPLADWLRRSVSESSRSFATDELSAHYADGESLRSTASGLLATFVDDGAGGRQHILLWFRPEVASTIVWGGDPNKPVMADAATRTVLPRRSFERWVEERRGRAEAWEPWQQGVAQTLAAAIEGVVLRQGRRIAELTSKQDALSQALDDKDVLAREIDHRAKNSLQVVAGILLMQARTVADQAAKSAIEDTYGRVMSVARVHESLHQSADIQNVDLGLTLRKLCDDLSAGMANAGRRLVLDFELGLMVPSQTAVAMSLIATELVTNALKYAYGPDDVGEVDISVHARPEGGVKLRVADHGRGLPEAWSEAPRARGGDGGLGMRVIQAMLSQIGARMDVSSGAPGAIFTVSV